MRNRLRSGWLVLQTAFRADPVRTIGAVVLEGGGQAGRILVGVWLKLVTDGVITGDARSVVIGAIGLALSPAVLTTAGGFGIRMRLTLAEKTTFAFEKHYAEVSSSVSSLTHHENPEFRDKLELLRENRTILGGTTHALIFTFIFVLNAGTTLAVVASLHPLLLLLLCSGSRPRSCPSSASAGTARSKRRSRRTSGCRATCTSSVSNPAPRRSCVRSRSRTSWCGGTMSRGCGRIAGR